MWLLNLVPLITVLVGGTLHALPSICTNLEEQIPIVIVNVSHIYSKKTQILNLMWIIQGSGPFADILCKYLKSTESEWHFLRVCRYLFKSLWEAFFLFANNGNNSKFEQKFQLNLIIFSKNKVKNLSPSPSNNTNRRLVSKCKHGLSRDI
jgi:hypothetical protein